MITGCVCCTAGDWEEFCGNSPYINVMDSLHTIRHKRMCIVVIYVSTTAHDNRLTIPSSLQDGIVQYEY